MRRLVPSLLAICALGAVTHVTRAQVFQGDIPRTTIEIQTRERWMNARQMAVHTPTFRSTSVILIDASSPDSTKAGRVVTGIVGEQARINETFRLTTRADGHFGSAEILLRPVFVGFTVTNGRAGVTRSAADSVRATRAGLTDPSGIYLTLSAPRLWDIVPMFNPRRTQPGATWIDTISYTTNMHDFHQSMTGLRWVTIVRDTVVAGRRMWIVRDSAAVEATERYPLEERHLDSSTTVDRRTKGFIVGRALYDPELKLYRARVDSTAFRGVAVLRYPDGRAFTTPTRYERSRIWTLYEPAEIAARYAQPMAQRNVNAFSLVSVPRSALEERVADGDTRTIDSLYSAWTESRDADHRTEIKQLLAMWGARDPVSRARLRAARIAEGDTVYLVQNARYDAANRLTIADAQLLLPLMRDPGLAFQHGVSRDIPYERVVEALVRMPPAIERDTAMWVCEPAACRLFAEQWTTAREPRLKSVGLTVLALMNPRQWRDTFLVHARTDNLLQMALPLIAGNVGRFSVDDPVPRQNAPWTEWRDWLRGPLASPPPPANGVGRGAASAPPPDWLIVSGNWTGLRFVQAATGRDIAGELRALFANAPDDTARIVAANILAGMKALPWTPDSLATHVMSSSPIMRWFAAQLVSWGYSERMSMTWIPADSALNDAIQDQLFSGRLTGREPWPTVEQKLLLSGRAGPFQEPPGDAPGAVHPIYYRSDSLSAPIRAKFGDRLSMMPSSEWRVRPVRKGGEFWSISQIARSGPFARIVVGVSGQIERAPEQAPQAWASRTTYFLVLVNGQWLLVTKVSAAT